MSLIAGSTDLIELLSKIQKLLEELQKTLDEIRSLSKADAEMKMTGVRSGKTSGVVHLRARELGRFICVEH
jgi:hypothetical protein